MGDMPYAPIRDEVKTIIKLLRDETRNFHLNEVITWEESQIPGGDEIDRDQQIIRRPPQFFSQLPAIEVLILSKTTVQIGDPIREGELIDRFRERILFNIHVGRDQEIIYDGVRYADSVSSLRVIDEILEMTLIHSPRYSDPEENIAWADIRLEGTTFRPDAFKKGVDTLSLFVTFLMEKARPYYPDIPR